MQILVREVEATRNSCSATTLSALDFSYLKADLMDKNAVFHRWKCGTRKYLRQLKFLILRKKVIKEYKCTKTPLQEKVIHRH